MCMLPLWDPVNNVPRPCGHCSQCLKKTSKDWAVRGQLHQACHDGETWFLTFTYDDDHNPGVVCKAIAQALKKRYGYYNGTGIKSLMSGEYGERTNRPHYHMIAWGSTHYEVGRNAADDCWPYGHIEVYPATPATIAYTAGYESKSGKMVKRAERQGPDGCYLPFRLISQGISKNYAQLYGKRDMELGYTPIGGQKKPVSRYIQTHSGHCETFNKIWRIKKNSIVEWKFPKDMYKKGDDDHAWLLPEKIQLKQKEIDDMIVAGKKNITVKKL